MLQDLLEDQFFDIGLLAKYVIGSLFVTSAIDLLLQVRYSLHGLM
jgi:hypothetical protein